MKSYFRNIQSQIVSLINESHVSIDIAMSWFTNEVLFEAVLKQLGRGVSVNMIIINDQINNNPYGLDFDKFISKGGNLFLSEDENLMHHKFAIIDNEILINGSYNWTYFAEYKNHENVIIIYDKKTVNSFTSEFKRLMSHFNKSSKFIKSTSILNLENDLTSKRLIIDDLISKSYQFETKGSYSDALRIAGHVFEIDKSNNRIQRAIDILNNKEKSTNTRAFEISYPLLGTNSNLNDFKEALKAATTAYKKKKYEQAITYLNNAKDINSEFAEVYFWLGICYWKKQKYESAVDVCNEALKINPEYSAALNLRGIVYSELNKLDNAIDDFSRSYLMNNMLYKSIFNKGLILKRKGDTKRSNEEFRKCISVIKHYLISFPDDEEAYSIGGDCYSLLDEKSSATEFYSIAEKIMGSRTIDDKDLNVLDRINEGKKR